MIKPDGVRGIDQTWPELPWRAWAPTINTLQKWVQIVGSVHLALAPPVDHSWHVPLEVTPRGLTTRGIDYGDHQFAVDFDFVDHRLGVSDSRGGSFTMALEPRSLATFYREFMEGLHSLDIEVQISTSPVEVVDGIPFELDERHDSYEPSQANAFWRGVLQADRVMRGFHTGFLGQQSPVRFFWGTFDLAATRYSGRLGEEHAIGWRPLSDPPGPAFYAYVHPEPDGIRSAAIRPSEAGFDARLGEFILSYDAVRNSANPDALVLEFFRSTYEAGADLAGWDRSALEPMVHPDHPPKKGFSIWLTDAPW